MKRTMMALGVAAGMLLATGANAQKMYRCGNVYSQTPCGSVDQKEVSTLRHETPATPLAEGAKAECQRQLLQQVQFNDPESVRIESITRGQADVFTIKDLRLEGRPYQMMVNAKNSNGGYPGATPFRCIVTLDERRVLQITGSNQ
jgi:hypothetical protein